jgi:P-type Ca2+ transporter type 2C
MNKTINNKNTFHDVTIDHIFKQLSASPKGLSLDDAAERLSKYGLNKLAKKKTLSVFVLFLRQFHNPLIYILLFAMTLSFVTGHISDGVIIAIVVIVTNIVGFAQEFKANKALEELNSTIVYKAKVLRGGKLEVVKQEDIVVGDIIDVCPGDIVPADARLIKASDLRVFEASLTGESYPSKKFIGEMPTDTPLADRENIIYQGTSINEGTARAVVVATGENTEIGKIASMIKDTNEDITPLQKQINNFGKWLGVFLVVVNVLIFVVGILMGRPFFEMFMVAVVVVVSAVPEGLIPAMGIILALGMQKLVKKKGLVRRLVSAETLGSVSMICTDKTGTLTEGDMTVDSISTITQNIKINHRKINKEQMDHSALTALKIGALSNNAIVENIDKRGKMCVMGNTTERALLLVGTQFGYSRENLELSEERIAELPFSSKIKLMATLHKDIKDGHIMYVKGAPERVMPLCQHALKDNKEIGIKKGGLKTIEDKINILTEQGQRVLVVAYKKKGLKNNSKIEIDDINNLVFVGMFAIKDKIRMDAKEAIELCKKAGVKVAMITGDHAKTAIAIAKEMGLSVSAKHVLEGTHIDELDDDELRKRVTDVVVYARVEPRHKLKIVTLLQENGETVAMTGDGINDAPALKKSDIGVTMGDGTDVSKEVADLVLLDSSFMTIVEAIKQGRTTFGNIRKVIVYLFTDCFQEMVIIGTSVLVGWPLPILPVQVLWIKLVESPLPATSLSFEEAEVDVMKDKPRDKKERLLTKRLKINIAFYALVMDIFALSLFYYYWQNSGDIVKTRSIMFVALGMSTLFFIYNVRSMKKSVFSVNPFKNKFLVMATIIGFLLFLFAIYSKYMNKVLETTPLVAKDWGLIISYAVMSIFVFELGKRFSRKFGNKLL